MRDQNARRYTHPTEVPHDEVGPLNDHPPLKVVHAVRSDRFAGVERYVADVSAALSQRGHSATVVGGDPSRMADALVGSDVAYRPATRTPDVTRELVRVARDADVVHVHMTAAEFGAVLASPVVRAPIVATRHFAAGRGSSIPSKLVGHVIRLRLRIQISISKFVAAEVGEPTVTILNGVPDAVAVDPLCRVVLVAQRLESEKQSRDALDAWAASGLAADGWILRIAGDGSERKALERSVIDRGLHGVEFVGHRDDLPDVRRRAGVLLATTPREAFGLGVAEAMAAGLPVIAAGSGGHLETVGVARPDLLYRPGDVVEAARLLRSLADDLEARRQAGRDLRDFQRRELSLDRHVEALLECYRSVLPSRPNGRGIGANLQ